MGRSAGTALMEADCPGMAGVTGTFGGTWMEWPRTISISLAGIGGWRWEDERAASCAVSSGRVCGVINWSKVLPSTSISWDWIAIGVPLVIGCPLTLTMLRVVRLVRCHPF